MHIDNNRHRSANIAARAGLSFKSIYRTGAIKLKKYDSTKIKNIAIAGHAGSGKTSLTEALLFKSGASDRLGKVLDGNTVSDYYPDEI